MRRSFVAGLGLIAALGGAAAEESAIFTGEPVVLAAHGVRVRADPLRDMVVVDGEADGYTFGLPPARRWRVTAGGEHTLTAEADGYRATLELVPAAFEPLRHLAAQGVREPDWIDIDGRAVLAWADPGGVDLHYWTTAPRASGHCLLHLVWTPPADRSASDDALLDMLSREPDCRFDAVAREARAAAAELAPRAREAARAALRVLEPADGITAWLFLETAAGTRSAELAAATPEEGLELARRQVRRDETAIAYAVAYLGSDQREGRARPVLFVEASEEGVPGGMLFAFPLRGRQEPELTGYFWREGTVRSALP